MLLPVPALPLGPALGACSTAAQECPISELRTRLSPSLPAPALPPCHAHGKAGPRGAVFFSAANPPLISDVREFWLRCPLLTLHHLSTISINIVNGGLLKGNEEAGYQRDVPWDVSPAMPTLVTRDPVRQNAGRGRPALHGYLSGQARTPGAPLLRRLRRKRATHIDSGICLQHIARAGRGQVENDVIGKAVQLSRRPTVTCHRIGTREGVGISAASQRVWVEEAGYVVGPQRIRAAWDQCSHAVFEQD